MKKTMVVLGALASTACYGCSWNTVKSVLWGIEEGLDFFASLSTLGITLGLF